MQRYQKVITNKQLITHNPYRSRIFGKTAPLVHSAEEMDRRTIVTPAHFTSVNSKVGFVTNGTFDELNTDQNSETELQEKLKKRKLHLK